MSTLVLHHNTISNTSIKYSLICRYLSYESRYF
nr:MAG TPA: hypothetical protein [Caudoviricetes sp.]